MSHLHWMKLYIGDELAATSHMSPAEFGSYIYLKMHYWKFGSLPVDDDRLARIAHVSIEQWVQIKPSIEILFEDGWCSGVLDEQRAEAQERHQKRVEAGKKGGRPRKEEKHSYKHSFSEGKVGPKQPEPEPEPEPNLDSNPRSQSDERWALEEEGLESTREEPFGIPVSIDAGRAMLVRNGLPPYRMKDALARLMAGKLFPCDIENWQLEARGAA